jgi:hypothetical protein
LGSINPLVYQERCLLHAELSDHLHAGMAFTRAAGNNSYQTGPAVDGTTFIALNAGPNVPRFHYVPALGRPMLLVEPARTNDILNSNFVDVAPADDTPDGWTIANGAPGVHMFVDPGGPHGGDDVRLTDQAFSLGWQDAASLAAATTYAVSVWYRLTGAGGNAAFMLETNPGRVYSGALTGPIDWTRVQVQGTTVGAGGAWLAMQLNMPGNFCMPQAEAGAYASTWIPTSGGAATRAAELNGIAAAYINPAFGTVRVNVVPLYTNAQVAGSHRIFSFGANDYIEYEGGGDTIRVVNNGVARAASAGLTFSALDLLTVQLRYGPFGTRISVNGTETVDATAWTSVGAVAAFLGSGAASANLEAAAYADLSIWG